MAPTTSTNGETADDRDLADGAVARDGGRQVRREAISTAASTTTTSTAIHVVSSGDDV